MKNANTCDDLVRMVGEIERKLAKLNEEEQDEYKDLVPKKDEVKL